MNDANANVHPLDQIVNRPETDPPKLAPSQFGVVDLVIFTTAIALGFVSILPSDMRLSFAFSTAYSSVSAITLGAFFWLVRQKLKTRERISQPGAFFLLATGVGRLLFLASYGLLSLHNGGALLSVAMRQEKPIAFNSMSVSVGLVSILILIWGITRVSAGWKSVLLLVVVGRFVDAAPQAWIFFPAPYDMRVVQSQQVLSIVGSSALLAAAVACIVQMVIDYRRQRRWGLLHWLGVGSFLASELIPLFAYSTR